MTRPEQVYDDMEKALLAEWFETLGLTIVESGYLGYTEYGWFWWLPDWVQGAISTVWNRVACRYVGCEAMGRLEDDGEVIEDWVCIHCLREVDHDV